MTTSIPSAQPGLYRLCFGHQPWWWVPLSFTGMSRQLHEGNQCHLTVTTCPCRRRKEWWNWNLMEGNKPTLSTWTFDALKSWRVKLQGHLNPVPTSYVTTCQTCIFCTEKGGHPFTCVLSWLIRASFEITNKLDISDTLHSLDFRVEQHFLGTVSPFSSLNESEMRIITVVAWLWQTFLDPMDCSTSGLPVLYYLLEFAQSHVHRVNDATQPSHPLSPSPSTFSLSQHQGLFQWVDSSHQVAKVLEYQSFQWIFRVNFL